MNKENFTTLLTDLYQAYNPEYIQYIPQLVEKYSRMEFAAVDMVLLKYNRKNAFYYDPEKDTDAYKHNLIKEYSEGRRPLKDFRIQLDSDSRKEAVEAKLAEESKKFQENINQTIESLKEQFSGKEKDLISAYENKIKELNEKINSVQPVKLSPYDGLEVKIICNYTEQEVRLPNRDSILGMGVGSRIITKTKDGSKLIGLKVVDIMYDCVSDFDDKPIIEIIIDKE